jgi:Ca-activated chloride channel family protein
MTRFTLPGLLVLAAATLVAQQTTPPTPPQQGVFRGGVQTVAIYATVTDSSGRLVPDLEQKHFEVFDDGKPQQITLFKSDVQPITVVVMLDTSGSMTANFELLKQSAEQFVIRMLPDDKARIGSFSDKIIISPQFTSDRDDLIRTLHEDIQYGNPTFLWDAIDDSMTALSHQTGRRVVLVFTDGQDDKSRRRSFDDVLTRAQTDDYMVYGIGWHSNIAGLITRPDPKLKRLANETGGGYFEPTGSTNLGEAFTRIADELHRQYVIGFTPQSLDGRMHLVDVKVKVEGMTVRARKSYLASKSDAGGLDR